MRKWIWLVLILSNFVLLMFNVSTGRDYLLSGIALLALLIVGPSKGV